MLIEKTPDEILFEKSLKDEFEMYSVQTENELRTRLHGTKSTRGSSGKQFAGYITLEQFYRGDQWDHDEAPGNSQRTDNYCAMIVDNFGSLTFDAPVEIHCPSLDPTDDILEMKAEIKEKYLKKVYDENDADEVVFPDVAQNGSQYGDAFIKGPLLEKNGSSNKKDWKIKFFAVDNPANIRPIFKDHNYKDLYGFIDTTPVSPMYLIEKYGKEKLLANGIDIEKIIKTSKSPTGQTLDPKNLNKHSQVLNQKSLKRSEYWTAKVMAVFIDDKLIEYYKHDWGFVPLEYIKNIRIPNHPWGKSDIEDALDPQLSQTRTMNDLANALKFLSTITMKGKNLDGMEVLVHGVSKIFNIPDDAELDPITRSGDPYAAGNFSDSRRRAVLDTSGLSDALTASASAQNMSGRAMSVALQSIIRKLNPRIKRYQCALRSLNRNILKLTELYWPDMKEICMGDYTNEVTIVSTILRNIIDELNKFQSSVQSLTTTQRNLGIPQPRIEQKIMKRDLADPVLGPQIARQPALLAPQIQGGEGTSGTPGSNGETGLPSAPNQTGTTSSPQGAVNMANQQSNAAPVPTVNP